MTAQEPPPPPVADPIRPPLGRPPLNRFFTFTAIAVAGLVADLVTKSWLFGWPKTRFGGVHWLIDGYVGFQCSLNEGALFGLGQGAQAWFAAVSVLAGIGIVVWLFRYGAAWDWWLTGTLGAIMGGVLGNLYDRIGLPGMAWGRGGWPVPEGRTEGETIYAVRDWILLQLSDDMRWPNFNIADSLLVVGVAVLFFRSFAAPNGGSAAKSSGES
ncbi:MAG: signal peptidase II [Planctomycetota bacterium]